MRCPTCLVPTTDLLVTVRFSGQRRGLSVKLNGVPAHLCPRCARPSLEPEVRDEIEALGRTMAESAGPMCWQLERAA